MDNLQGQEMEGLLEWWQERERRHVDDPGASINAIALIYMEDRGTRGLPSTLHLDTVARVLHGFASRTRAADGAGTENVMGVDSTVPGAAPMRQDAVLSGVRATGSMHLGNYLGVLERFAAMSRDVSKRCFFFVADLHTLTTHKEARDIRAHAPNIVLDMLAAGVDPERAVIYVQSRVPVVTELMWYLACLAPTGDLERMPTFKEKADKHSDDVNGGLYCYPVLMAADILGARADLVPVGKDQQPHLEFARELARRFNARYETKYLVEPDGMAEESITVPGLVVYNEELKTFAKMGKSEAPEQTLYLADSAEAMAAKIRRAPTDPQRARRTDPGDPQKCALFQLHALVSSNEEFKWSANGCRTAGISCVECKDVLARNVTARLAAFHERRAVLAAHPERIEEVLHVGTIRATTRFEETTAVVADYMGVYRPKLTRTP